MLATKVAYYYLCSMKFNPKALFFDWDHTLWDHDRNAKEVIFDLLTEFNIPLAVNKSMEDLWSIFHQLNDQIWNEYQLGQISQQTLRETRFIRFFQSVNFDGSAKEFSEQFLYRTPRKTHVFNGVHELIPELAQRYPLYILTNGFDDIQHVKVAGTGLSPYFQSIITSEMAGAKKPDSRFFTYALDMASCEAHEVVMIGDHPIFDIQGAENVGIPAIHVDYQQKFTVSPNRIQAIQELKTYLI
jgi:YjjG family noncanonical pyrimidine nucleotidase